MYEGLRQVAAIILAIILGLMALYLYFLPMMVAAGRNHPHWPGLAFLNLVAGWTALGWLIAMVWALSLRGPEIRATPTDNVRRSPTLSRAGRSGSARIEPYLGRAPASRGGEDYR